jgi:diacylglycerol kinase (ATP)
MQRDPILVLVNPSSGGGMAKELGPHLVRELEERGLPVIARKSERAGEITEEARRRMHEVRAIVAVGGDGTMREVLAAKPPESVTVTMLPAGTANVLSAELALPKRPAETAKMLAAGHSRSFDIGLVSSSENPEGSPFLLFVGAGSDARVIADVHQRRAGGTLGKMRYIGPIAREIFRYRPTQHHVVLDDGQRIGPFEQVLITNVAAYGGLWRLPGGVRMDDGLFDVFGFRIRNGLALLSRGIRGSLNQLEPGDDVVHLQSTRARIESDAEGPTQIDGDPGPSCPVDVCVQDQQVRLALPPDSPFLQEGPTARSDLRPN